jgi:membrane-associated phospholipid phosphatase
MEGVYLTWLITSLAIGVLLLPLVKPPWTRIYVAGFIDFIRRYWIHISLLLVIYNAKDFLDQVDRVFMANTGLDMTPWIYAIEGDMVLWVQKAFLNPILTSFLTHFYVIGFMVICYVSIFYFAYFDDRWMSDRITLSIFWVYVIAVPFYLFFNVRVTGDHIPEMQTLAYNLTPEINDWFTRIDPFTNGMPSLHIAFPFAVWLCLLRFDVDNRWRNYRNLLIGYILLTAFAIIYLGIHWFSDIIGGMIVGAIAVRVSEKTQGVWIYLDERTINSRLTAILTNPRQVTRFLKRKVSETFGGFKRPGSSETGAVIAVLILLIAATITWDLTHQALPAGGVEAPVAVVAADGWVVTLDDRPEGALVVVHDLSDLESEIQVHQPLMDANSSYDVGAGYLAMANESDLFVISLANPSQAILQIKFNNSDYLSIIDSSLGVIIAILSSGDLTLIDLQGNEVIGPEIIDDEVLILENSGDELAMVMASNPARVTFGIIGAEGMITQTLNHSASESEDAILAEWGVPVDSENATITDLSLTRDFLAATVNVSATTRLVLLERAKGDSYVVGDPKYPTFDPHLGHGLLVWAAQEHLNPINPSAEYLDKEIHLLDLSTNRSEILTSDEYDQWGPMVLENHIVYSQMDDNGEVSVEIHQRVASLKPYSSIVLQVGVILTTVLLLINIFQRQIEARVSNLKEEE